MIENLDHDATVLPTDADFWVVRGWASALGVGDSDLARDDRAWDSAAPALEPEHWPDRRWGRARAESSDIPLLRPTWFLDASANGGPDTISAALDDTIERVRAVLLDIAQQPDLQISSQRPRPLVAADARCRRRWFRGTPRPGHRPAPGNQ